MTDPADLAVELRQTALCHTDHPADAATVLLRAAGEVLHTRFGTAGAIALLRQCIDDTEAVLTAAHGSAEGRMVQ